MKLEVEISAEETCHNCGIGFPVGFRRIVMNNGKVYHEGCLATGHQEGLSRDHWLISGRIDGIREALEIMRSGISRNQAEERLEKRISELMNAPHRERRDARPMNHVTAEQCKHVVRETGMTYLGHHRCGVCNVMVGHIFRHEGDDVTVGFDPRCGCPSFGYYEPRTWEQFADTFNMQSKPEVRAEMWERFKAGKATHEAH